MVYASSPILQSAAAQIPSLAETDPVLVSQLADMQTLRYVIVACLTVSI